MAEGIKFEDSNMALFGTEIEKNLKYNNAQNEPEWHKIPQEPCTMIWRIEKFNVVPWPKEQYGSFYQGDTYIILNIVKEGDSLEYTAFLWEGKESTKDEIGTGAYKIVELDDFFKGNVDLSLEMQGEESDEFFALFPEFIVMEGGIPSGFKKVEEIKYPVRLLKVLQGVSVKSVEVPLLFSSLTQEDGFIIDTGMELFTWRGENAGSFKKFNCVNICNRIKESRGGKPKITVFEEGDKGTLALMQKYLTDDLKGEKPKVVLRSKKPKKVAKKMFKLSDATGELKLEEIKYAKESLSSKDTFLIDNGKVIYIWTGKNASKDEKRYGIVYAKKYQESCGREINNQIVMMKEGSKKYPVEKIFI